MVGVPWWEVRKRFGFPDLIIVAIDKGQEVTVLLSMLYSDISTTSSLGP